METSSSSPVKWVLTHADDEEEYSFFNIAVSGDRYHEDILAANMLRYYRCGFFSKMKMQNEKREYILVRGRGVSIPGSFDRTITRLSIEESNDEMAVDEVYVSCTGAVVTDCDLPYEDIDSGESVAYLGKVTMKTPLAGHPCRRRRRRDAAYDTTKAESKSSQPFFFQDPMASYRSATSFIMSRQWM